LQVPDDSQAAVDRAVVCGCMLTYADVCFLQVPDDSQAAVDRAVVCGRMLTYADVC
jgi:hypothetical protein